MVRILVRGIGNEADAVLAWRAGADAISVVLDHGRRQVEPELAARICAAVPPWVVKFGEFRGERVEIDPHIGVQAVALEIDRPEVYARYLPNVVRTLHVRAPRDIEGIRTHHAGAFMLVVDEPTEEGGRGRDIDWAVARAAVETGRPIILAGGLRADNVALAIERVRPMMVAVGEGVEAGVGHLDPERLAEFVKAVRAASW
jgi:phosphoribosylanthranilate isomerase